MKCQDCIYFERDEQSDQAGICILSDDEERADSEMCEEGYPA